MSVLLAEYYVDILEFLDQWRDVEEFYIRVCNLHDLILENDSTYKESYFIACFIQGLKQDIGEFVLQCGPVTLNSAYAFVLQRESENKKEENGCATDDMTKHEELVVAISPTHSEEFEKLAGVTAVLLSCSANIVLLPTGVYNNRGTNAGYILEAKQFTDYSLQHPTFFYGIGISVPTTTSRVRVTTSPPPLTISLMRDKAFFASDADSRFEGYPRNFTLDVFLIFPSVNDIDWRHGILVQCNGFSHALLCDHNKYVITIPSWDSYIYWNNFVFVQEEDRGGTISSMAYPLLLFWLSSCILRERAVWAFFLGRCFSLEIELDITVAYVEDLIIY